MDADTVCDSDNCNDNYYVSDHECIECAPGTYNSSGDDTKNLILYAILYNVRENEYVSNHTCQACPVGTYNAAGDLASEPDTVCDRYPL